MAQVPPHQRVLLIRSLRKLRSHGHLTSGDVRYAARTLQVDERTVWRWLQGDTSGQPGRPRYRLTNADRDALADWRGSVARATSGRRGGATPAHLPAGSSTGALPG